MTAARLGHRIDRRSRWSFQAKKRDAQDQEADDRGDRAVDPLPPGLGVVERRQELAVAQRPVRAAHAGAGGAHDDAHGHEQDRRDDRGDGDLLEAGHGRCGRPRGRAAGVRGGSGSGPGGTQGAILPARRADRPGGVPARVRASGYDRGMRHLPIPRAPRPARHRSRAVVAAVRRARPRRRAAAGPSAAASGEPGRRCRLSARRGPSVYPVSSAHR